MPKRIPLLIALVACLALAGQTTAHASERNAAIAGAVVGAVVGGAIVANSRYAPAPVYVEVAPPPPRVVYYEPEPVYYQPYPVVVERHYRHGHGHKHHYRHHRRHHRHDHRGYYGPRW